MCVCVLERQEAPADVHPLMFSKATLLCKMESLSAPLREVLKSEAAGKMKTKLGIALPTF